jgi:hypothetical protein
MESSQLTRTFFLPLPCQSKKLFRRNRLECDPPRFDSDSFLFGFSGAVGRQQQPVCGMANSIQVEPTTESKVACVIAGFLFSLSPLHPLQRRRKLNLVALLMPRFGAISAAHFRNRFKVEEYPPESVHTVCPPADADTGKNLTGMANRL